VFCLYASVTSWRAASHTSHVLHHDSHYFGHHFSHDPIYILGSVVSIFILGDIAFESPLRAIVLFSALALFRSPFRLSLSL
jgi:hypothetical protein